jgi:shikimate kinase
MRNEKPAQNRRTLFIRSFAISFFGIGLWMGLVCSFILRSRPEHPRLSGKSPHRRLDLQPDPPQGACSSGLCFGLPAFRSLADVCRNDPSRALQPGPRIWIWLEISRRVPEYTFGQDWEITEKLSTAQHRLSKMIILLIGPSAVGKTTLGRICVSQTEKCEFIDLDDAIAVLNGTSTAYESAVKFGLAKFLDDCRDIVAKYDLEYAHTNSTLLIAVGEWALRMDRLERWLSAYKTISIIAPAEEVYQRCNNLTEISPEDYYRYNYSEARKRVFASCSVALDIGGLTQEESVEKLKQAVESLRLLHLLDGGLLLG